MVLLSVLVIHAFYQIDQVGGCSGPGSILARSDEGHASEGWLATDRISMHSATEKSSWPRCEEAKDPVT